jgi:hypothetical protein
LRQSGGHFRLQAVHPEPHALIISNHSPLKLGTLAAILVDVADRNGLTRDELLNALFRQ